MEKVWSGIKDDIHFNKELNFGELILAKLSDTNDDDRVLQVRLIIFPSDLIY